MKENYTLYLLVLIRQTFQEIYIISILVPYIQIKKYRWYTACLTYLSAHHQKTIYPIQCLNLSLVGLQMDAESLANTIRQVLSDQNKLVDMGFQCRKTIIDHYTLSKQAEVYSGLYESLLDTPKR